MMINMNMNIKVKEEPAQMQVESSVDEEENDHIPISQLFQLIEQRRSSMPMEVHDYPQKAARCKMKRPRDKNYKDHVVKALPAAKTKTEEAWENPSVTKRAEEFQANLSDEFPSFLKIMIPSNVCRGYYMSLPKEFSQLYLPSHDSILTLVDDGGKEYRIFFLAQRRALSGGWMKFSTEHGLLVGDVLIFHLFRPSKFKIYIVRVNGLAEVDAALGLLRLQSSSTELTGINHAGKNASVSFSTDINQNEVHMNSLSYLKAEENQSENDSLDIGSSEVEGIRSSPEVNAEFKQLRGTTRASEISNPRPDFVAWDNNAGGFELLGRDVGFSHNRNRMHQLLSPSFESNTRAMSRRYKEAKFERASAEEEGRSLELELLEKKKEIQKLDTEIEGLNVNGRRFKLVFEAAANAPWR